MLTRIFFQKYLLLFFFNIQVDTNIFSEVPIIVFLKKPKSLKDDSVRAFLPQLDREGRSKPCKEANCPCELCESVKDTIFLTLL